MKNKQAKSSSKKYRKPVLVSYGTLQDLTTGGSNANLEGQGPGASGMRTN